MCIHCGNNIKKSNENAPFHFLNEERRKELFEEFISQDAENAKTYQCENKLRFVQIVYSVAFILLVVFLISIFFVVDRVEIEDLKNVFIALAIWLFTLLIDCLIISIRSRKLREKSAKALKKFQIWLKENKDIEVNFNLVGINKKILKLIEKIDIERDT